LGFKYLKFVGFWNFYEAQKYYLKANLLKNLGISKEI
jgi:hypothetical protein